MTANTPLVLASSSPRRLDLLRQIGVVPAEVVSPDIDETPGVRELPRDHALRLALEKARAVVSARRDRDGPPSAVLAADTVVAMGRRILPKADDAPTARQCLERLSGRRHRVFGGVALIGVNGGERTKLVQTIVHVRRLDRGDIDRYIEAGDWQGKAGGYAIQGAAAAFVPRINGSYSNVVGLPLFETAGLLRWAGVVT